MIIFIYGQDTFRSRQKLKAIKKKFRREVDPGGSGITHLDGEKAGVEDINEAAAAPSLFAQKRLVVVENLLQNKSKDILGAAEKYLKRLDKKSENIIVIYEEEGEDKLKKKPLFKYLEARRFAQEFKPLSNTEATRWVSAEVKKRGGQIRGQAALHLTSLFGSDLWQLNHEINKLISFKQGQTPELVEGGPPAQIEVKDVDRLSRGQADENIFALTDAISQRNRARALELLEDELRAGVTDSYLLYMIIRQFRILLQVRAGLDQGLTQRQLMNELKLHPFVAQKAVSQVRNFSQPVLKRLFQALTELDRRIKTGAAELRPSLAQLIARI